MSAYLHSPPHIGAQPHGNKRSLQTGPWAPRLSADEALSGSALWDWPSRACLVGAPPSQCWASQTTCAPLQPQQHPENSRRCHLHREATYSLERPRRYEQASAARSPPQPGCGQSLPAFPESGPDFPLRTHQGKLAVSSLLTSYTGCLLPVSCLPSGPSEPPLSLTRTPSHFLLCCLQSLCHRQVYGLSSVPQKDI